MAESTSTEQTTTQQTAPALTPEQAQQILSTIETLKQEVGQAKNALLDPTYIEYVASKVEGRQTAKAEAKKTADAAPKLSDLSPEEFAEVVKAEAKKTAEAAILPDVQARMQEKAVEDVAKTAQKYEDFWDYQKEMQAIAYQKPNLTAEECYILAKTKTPAKPKPVKAEAPTGMAATKIVREPAKGFNSKFGEAWKRAFGTAEVAS